ncbi:hypothetical protein [Pontibacter ramchanderi]|uniref:hypothetical protein n=1 Tax=Pontibacter ramchanderi TaxID=1179743 RepID=UPI00117DFCFC|nr:hypothetical protein [Pontibacter ramchanderi]
MPDLEEDEEDFAVLESEVLAVVLEPAFAFIPVDFVSEEVVLLLLFDAGLELEEEEPMLELPWFMESMPDPLELDPLWLEVPEDMPLDMLPDWLDD